MNAYIDDSKTTLRESSENKDMTNDIEKNLKAIRMLLKQVSWEGLCDIWVEYNYVDKEYEIRSKSELQDEISPLADIQEELVFLSNIIRSIGLSSYIYGTWFVDNCEDEVKFMDENINESKEESKKEMIENVLNNIILPEYDHVICGFEVKEPNERNTLGNNTFKFVSVTVTFIGGHGTKLFPKTQGVQKMYDEVLDEVWDVIYNYTNEAVDVSYKTVNDCGKKNIYLKESIRKVLKEDRQPSNFLRRRLDMLDYEVERGFNGPFGGSNICIFFKSDIEFFESVMENAIDAMYYNHFSHIDDGSGEWANEYLDMVDYIRNKYKDKIMKHYDDNCGSGSIPLKESIRRVLREETDGVNTLIDDITSRHEMSDELIEKVKDFISQSNCKKIEFANFKMPAMGVALHDGVLINKIALNQRLEYLLFIIFHETAHQYQFKKYGEDIMYECYIGDISVEEAAKLMKHTEEVADEFAGKKIKQLQKEGLLNKGFIPPSFYKSAPISQIIAMVGFYRSQLKQQNITTPDKISEFFYNMVKNNI